MNSNGLRLLSFCSEYQITKTNTRFQFSNKHKNTWKHPHTGHWHMLDQVMIRQRVINDCMLTKVMRGAGCGTDHLMHGATFQPFTRPPVKKRASTTKKPNTTLLNGPNFRQKFQFRVKEVFQARSDKSMSAPQASSLDSWENFWNLLYATSDEVLGK